MGNVTILAAGYADPSNGWGGIWGLLGGAVVVYLLWRGDKWRLNRNGGEGGPSPAEPPAPVSREIAQVDHVSSHVSRETPAPRGGGETPHWGGRIKRVNGSLRRVYTVAKNVVTTGDSAPRRPEEAGHPAVEQAHPPADDEIDIPLDEEWDDEGDEESEVPPGARVVARESAAKETREQYAARLHQAGEDKAVIVAGLIKHYGVARATAYRIHDRLPGARKTGRRAA